MGIVWEAYLIRCPIIGGPSKKNTEPFVGNEGMQLYGLCWGFILSLIPCFSGRKAEKEDHQQGEAVTGDAELT